MEKRTATEIARREPGIHADDRLSSLPEEVITHILSFLQTKYAVGTAVLSRRWKDLWTRVSNLDLDNTLVYQPLPRNFAFFRLRPDVQKEYLEARQRKLSEFYRFVCKVLSQHKNLDSVRRFRFHCRIEYGEDKVSPPDFWFEREWVEEIDLMLNGERQLGLPHCMCCLPQSFYTLKNLKVLKLKGVILSAPKGSVLLPSVKILQLCYFEINDLESLSSLISGCPVLETAVIEYGFILNMNEEDILSVSLPSVKNLKMNCFRNDRIKCPIVLETPNLEELDLHVKAVVKFLGSSPLSCLHSAHVYIGSDQSSNDSLAGILSQISNAKKLFLSYCTLSLLSVVGNVQFPNLTHLTIQTKVNSRELHSLLHSAPKLHSLVIEKTSFPERMEWEMLDHLWTPECLLSSLEEIEVKYLAPNEDEMKMVAYLLKAGVVLKKVNMHAANYYLHMKGRKELASLLKLPRGSSRCEARLWLSDDKEICIDSDNDTDIDDDMDDDDSEGIDDETDNKG